MKIGEISITLPQLALLLANLIPIFGVLYLDWDVGSIIVLYWAENLVIGLYTILKMLVTGGIDALGRILFFCIHYGFFAAVHGIFVLELTDYAGISAMQEAATSWPGPLVLIEKLYNLITRILSVAQEEVLWVLLAMLLSHGASFLLLFIGQGEYRETTPSKLMQAPYKRVAILHVAVILGAFLVIRLGTPIGLLLALVALKTGMDIILHIRAHKDRLSASSTSGQEIQGE